MKLVASALLAAAPTLLAQTSAKPATHAPVHHTAAAQSSAAAAGGCVKVPELSPKIPALPAGAPCPHALYTITAEPPAKLDYVSPLEPASFAEELGLTPSSFTLAYVDTKPGTGALAAPHKWYTIHYTGYLTDGTKFDSSLDRNEPIVIQIGEHQVIRGWDTGFAGMHVGGKRRLFIPSQLAYGAQGRPGIPPNSELVFDVEFVAQSDTEPKPQPKPEAPATAPASTTPANPSQPPTTPPQPSAQPATPPQTPQP
jgi:peptidylprolyl isomerase